METDSVWARLEDAMDAVSELAELKEEREEPDISMSAALAMNGWRSDWFTVEVRDVSYAIKPPTWGINCLSLCLYGIRAPYNRFFLSIEATLMS